MGNVTSSGTASSSAPKMYSSRRSSAPSSTDYKPHLLPQTTFFTPETTQQNLRLGIGLVATPDGGVAVAVLTDEYHSRSSVAAPQVCKGDTNMFM